MPRIAELNLNAVRSGASRQLCIALHAPELDPKDASGHTFRTLLEFGDFYKPMFIHGVGSLQSLGLAVNMLRDLLEILEEGKWVLHDPETGEVVDSHLNIFRRPKT